MIPAIDFDNLFTSADWNGALKQILDAVSQAVQDASSNDRATLNRMLFNYKEQCPESVAASRRIAAQAIQDLAVTNIQECLNRIAARSAELAALTGTVKTVTAGVNKKTAATDAMTAGIGNAKTFVDDVKPLVADKLPGKTKPKASSA